MKQKKVLKFLSIVASIFVILSILEITYIILFNFTEFNFNGSSILLHEFIYSASIIPLSGTLLWLFLMISMFCFLILGIFMYKVTINKKIESRPLAKFMVVMGMVILLTGFVKLNYLVLLGKTKLSPISIPDSITFQSALYDLYITPLIPALFWTFFISVNCYILMAGLIITAFCIKWTLLQEEAENSGQK